MIRRGSLLVLLLVGWLGAPSSTAATGTRATLSDCDASRREHPDTLEPYMCYWIVGHQSHVLDQAAERLETILTEQPDNGRAELYLGLVEADLGRAGADGRFRSAAGSCAGIGDRLCEVYARQSLVIYLINHRRLDGIEQEFEAADAAALASGDPALIAGVNLERGRLSFERTDYGNAWTWFRRAESALFPDGPARLQARALGGLAGVAWATGRHREALELYTRQAALQTRDGVLSDLAATLSNVSLLGGTLLAEGEMTNDEVRLLQQQALDAARAAASGFVEANVLIQMAQDPERSPEERVTLARQALALARRTGNLNGEMFAMRYIALTQFNHGLAPSGSAFALLDDAIRLAERSADLEQIARGRLLRAQMRWVSGPHDQAIADSIEAFEAIERIRDLQTDDLIRARSFSEFAFFYYRVAGQLLDPAGGAVSPDDLERAFAAIERLRARVLMQSLDAAGVVRPRVSELDRRHEEILEAISRAQRRLSSGRTDAETLLAEIERLEIEEVAARDEIARQDPRFSNLLRSSTPTIAGIQAALAPDQAMLAFQLSTHGGRSATDMDNGGSWVFVLTRDTARALPLPDVEAIEPAVSIFLGSLRRRDDLARVTSRRLAEQLTDGPLSGLPSRIRRLVIIPDRCLHRLPFGALAIAGSRSLVERYEISVAPSAALWLRWKTSPAEAKDLPVLAVADPGPSGGTVSVGMSGIERWTDGPSPGTLRHARREARTAVLLARGGVVLQGKQATERSLKRMDLSRFGILHIAAHSFVDEERPIAPRSCSPRAPRRRTACSRYASWLPCGSTISWWCSRRAAQPAARCSRARVSWGWRAASSRPVPARWWAVSGP